MRPSHPIACLVIQRLVPEHPCCSMGSLHWQPSSFLSGHVLASVPFALFPAFRPFFLFPLRRCSRILTRSWPARASKSSGESVERFALFPARTAVSRFNRLSFPSVRLFSLARTTADVLPLSSRKKFFHNFRIALFRPALFPSSSTFTVQEVCPRASLSLHHPTFLFLNFFLVSPFAYVCAFLVSRFSPRSIHPSPLNLLAFRSVSWTFLERVSVFFLRFFSSWRIPSRAEIDALLIK